MIDHARTLTLAARLVDQLADQQAARLRDHSQADQQAAHLQDHSLPDQLAARLQDHSLSDQQPDPLRVPQSLAL